MADVACGVPGGEGAALERDWCRRLFWGWLAVRTLLWTLAASARYVNAPVDVLEMLAWGRQWELGYHKHPPLPAWAAEAAAWLSQGNLAAVYLTSYLFLAVAIWAAWRLGLQLLTPRLALASVLALEGCAFFTYRGGELNHNVTLTCFWALCTYLGWLGVRGGRPAVWCAYGAATGLGLLSKYNLGLLLAWQGVAFLATAQGRRALRTPGPYLACLIGLALFLPHLHWLVESDYQPIRYLQGRSVARAGVVAWFAGAGGLVGELAWLVGGSVALLAVLLAPRRRDLSPELRDARTYLSLCVLGPLAVVLTLVVLGRRVIGDWCFPFFTFLGVLGCLWFQPRESWASWRRACLTSSAVGLVLLLGSAAVDRARSALGSVVTRTHYPGQLLGEEVTRLWREEYGDRPLPLVAGENWVVTNAAWYAPDRPAVYLAGPALDSMPCPRTAPWASDDQFRRGGGVIVWEVDAKCARGVAGRIRERFPSARVLPPLQLPYHASARTVGIGVALVPPSDHPAGKVAARR